MWAARGHWWLGHEGSSAKSRGDARKESGAGAKWGPCENCTQNRHEQVQSAFLERSISGPASPIASGLHFATTAVATGPRLHYAEQGDPGGAALLFIHGWPDSWFSFSRVLPLLPTAYHAYAIDLRGFGDSERPADSYTIDQFATDVLAMDAVGIARATLIGHSMGTFIARRVAHPAETRGAAGVHRLLHHRAQ